MLGKGPHSAFSLAAFLFTPSYREELYTVGNHAPLDAQKDSFLLCAYPAPGGDLRWGGVNCLLAGRSCHSWGLFHGLV